VFGRKNGSEEFNGFLGEGTSVNGDLYFTGTLHLDGNVHGSITTTDVLIVGARAVVEARVKAGEVQISGSITGDVEGTRRVEILEGGRLIGDVKTAQLIINEGGVFQGMSLGVDSGETLQLSTRARESSESTSDIAEYSTP
jgi:cytoskeletal protein CcmA (bactofilin family)